MNLFTPIELFKKLFAYYGPQNWWPGQGFEIAIGAVLTQNTAWKNVELALVNLRKNNLTEPAQLIVYPLEQLKDLIRPAGFYNQKALSLIKLSKLFIDNPTPSRGELLSIKGIGEETADSILLYLFGETVFVIDAYTVRISQRIGFNSSNDKTFWKKFYESKLPKDSDLFNEFHALFVIHGKNFCAKKTPNCLDCFLANDCFFAIQKKNHSNLKPFSLNN